MSKLVSSSIIASIPLILVAVDFFLMPDQLAWYLSTRQGIGVIVFAFLWFCLGFFLLNKTQKFLRALVALFILPIPLIFIFAPAVFTIMSAIGPIIQEPPAAHAK